MTRTEQSGSPGGLFLTGGELLDLLFRRSGILLAAVLAVSIAVMAYLLSMPRAYRSEAVLSLRHNPPAGLTVPKAVTEDELREEIQVLSSAELLETAAEASGLVPPPAKRTPALLEGVMEELRAGLSFKSVLQPPKIHLAFRAQDREEGAHFLRELLRLHQAEKGRQANKSRSMALEEESQQLAERLRMKQLELTQFQRTNNIVALEDQKALALRRLTDAESALRETELRAKEAQQRVVELESTLSHLPARLTTRTRRMPNQYSAERLKIKLVDLENRRLDAQGSGESSVKRISDQIELTRQALADAQSAPAVEESTGLNQNREALERDLMRYRVDASAASGRQAGLAVQTASYRQELARLEGFTLEYQGLTRAVQELDERYRMQSRRFEESRIDSIGTDSRLAALVTVEPAVPARPEPLPLGKAGAIWVLAILAALCAVLTIGRGARVVQTAGGLEALTGMPVLGTLPLEEGGAPRR